MYKLLTTVAIVAISASAVSANDWTGAKELTNNLKDIYTNLDGGNEFNTLQGDFSGNDGQLADFFNEVDKGVTYITVSVDANNNISTGINEGSTFGEIQVKQTNLVNRVNYDLFKNGAADPTYVSTKDYTGTTGFVIPGSNEGTSQNEYSTDLENGLAGRKIVKLVDGVNAANDYLIASNRTTAESQAVIDAFNSVEGTGVFTDATDPDNILTADLTSIQGHIGGLNAAINTARDVNVTTGTNSFFGNIGLGGLDEDGVNNFLIPSFNSFDDIGNAGAGGFNSISDWAIGQQTVTVDGTDYHFQGTDTITVDGTNVTVGNEPTKAITEDARFVAVP